MNTMNTYLNPITLLKIALTVVIAVGILHILGVIGFHVPRWSDEEMPADALRVVNVTSNRIYLSTGQTLVMQSTSTDLHVIRSNDCLRISQAHSDDDRTRYVVEHFALKTGYCGTPYTCLICLPIFKDRIPRRQRQFIGEGRLISQTP